MTIIFKTKKNCKEFIQYLYCTIFKQNIHFDKCDLRFPLFIEYRIKRNLFCIKTIFSLSDKSKRFLQPKDIIDIFK